MTVRFNLLLACGAWAAAALHADVRSDAHRALLGDFAMHPNPPRAAKAVAKVADPGPRELPPARTNLAPVVAPREDPVDKFFRTGILVGDRPSDPDKKISVGPCEGGQLLNLRSSW